MFTFYITCKNDVFMTQNDNEKPRWLGKLACETTSHVFCRLGMYGEVHAYPKRLGLGGCVKFEPDQFSDFQAWYKLNAKPFQSTLRPIDEYYLKAV